MLTSAVFATVSKDVSAFCQLSKWSMCYCLNTRRQFHMRSSIIDHCQSAEWVSNALHQMCHFQAGGIHSCYFRTLYWPTTLLRAEVRN